MTEALRIVSLAVGDELLDGRVADGNTKDLGDALSQLGLELCAARTVPDARAVVVAAVRAAADEADVVVTSGGLGPTSDDITAECIAEAAGVGLRFDAAAFARIEAMFALRSIPMPESNRRQAMLPATSRTLENEQGTAPGFVTPLMGARGPVEVWSFPGVPREYRHLLEDRLLPELRARLDRGASRVLVRRTLRSLGLSESAVGERLGALERDNPDVRVQYRAACPEILVRVIVTASERAQAEARADELAARARADIGASVYGVGDEPLEERVLRALENKGATLAVAESCTGGLVAKRLTDVPGSSSVVQGGVVAYANQVKTAALDVPASVLAEHGAVSEAVARAMADGARARLGADWAISTTGVAGPTGGSEDKPVGLVWFGVAGPGGTAAHKKRLPDFGRERVREMAAAWALRFLLEAADVA
ncbi:MAG: CinA family nicotinamide mononucleotide deamidase-related protein [Deltaproteobacteria bacterium]|nr:CinA family nicotinamide mononucleotide deamidase-related protein [Deltaproteobacteria bacterium]